MFGKRGNDGFGKGGAGGQQCEGTGQQGAAVHGFLLFRLSVYTPGGRLRFTDHAKETGRRRGSVFGADFATIVSGTAFPLRPLAL